MERYLIFGSSGHLGSAIAEELESRAKTEVVKIAHSTANSHNSQDSFWVNELKIRGPFNGVVWAQGLNISDSIMEFEIDRTISVLDANVLFILTTLKDLLKNQLLNQGSRLVIISSVWQKMSRQNKLSYTVSKAAIAGLLSSLVADLGERNIAVNAILPGVVESPMTRSNLSINQLTKIQDETPVKRLVTAKEVAKTANWLLSGDSFGVNGQSITVDNGWSETRIV